MNTPWYLAALFGVYPYLCLTSFVVGHIWRYRYDKFGWTTRTSQLMEKRWQQWGSPLFHIGALLVIGGHALGLIIPQSLTAKLGVSEHQYHLVATGMGTLSGLVLFAGVALLIARRFVTKNRFRLVTTAWDRVMYCLLGLEICVGLWSTLQFQLFGSGNGYNYRDTISPWFRSVFFAHPDVTLMSSVPAAYKLHVLIGFAFIAIWPYTRLVHVWSVPVQYLARPYVVYRRERA